MFTGIIRGKFPIVFLEDKPGLRQFDIALSPELIDGIKFGASIAVDGVCLTAARFSGNHVGFDAMEETMRKTTIGQFKQGDQVNIERSARMGDEIGGHIMSGHVSTMAKIIAVETPENNKVMTFKLDPIWMKFIFSKGFIGLDGASLTVVEADKQKCTFQVWFIPETLRLTRFGEKTVGDHVNVEIDSGTQTIVETIENYLKNTSV
jgi:riboflavin synthase